MGKGGDNAGPSGPPAELLEDPLFAPFMDPDFDALKFASGAVVQGGDSSAHLRDIRGGIDRLEREIREHLSGHQEELMGSLDSLGSLETGLDKTSLSITYLRSLASRIRSEVVGSASRVGALTTQASNLRATIDLLQHTTYRLKLINQLRSSTSSGNLGLLEAASAARILFQIQSLDDTSRIDISEVEALREHDSLLRAARQSVVQRAQTALREGLSSHSQAEIGSGLQIFFNLGTLPEAVDPSVADAITKVDSSFALVLDPRRRSRPAAQAAPPSQATPPWEGLASALSTLRENALAMWHLEQVLLVKRDAATGHAFLSAALTLPAESTEDNEAAAENKNIKKLAPVAAFWAGSLPALMKRFEAAYNVSLGNATLRTLREALEGSYPRLSSALEDTVVGLQRDIPLRNRGETRASISSASISVVADPSFSGLIDVALSFRQAYLAGVSARLLDALSSTFLLNLASGNVTSSSLSATTPSPADAQRLVARMHEEIKTGASGGKTLAGEVAAIVARVLRGGSVAALNAASSGPDLRAVSSTAPRAIQRNIAICNALAEVPRCLSPSLPWLDGAGAAQGRAEIESVLCGELASTALDLVLPTLRALSEWLEEPILRLSANSAWLLTRDSASTDVIDDVIDTSEPVQELGRRLTHARREILSRFSATSLAAPAGPESATSVAKSLITRLAARLITVYVRHASLARPLSDQQAALQIAKDIGEIEGAISQTLVSLEAIPEPVRQLRAFRKALFVNKNALADAVLGVNGAEPQILSALSKPIALHILIGRGPESLPSPFAKANLTVSQYSLWLDDHTDHQAVDFISNGVMPTARKLSTDDNDDNSRASALAILRILEGQQQ